MIKLSTRQKIFVARALYRVVVIIRSALALPMEGEFKRGGIRWNLQLKEGIDFSIYLLGAFEWDLRRFYERNVETGSTALDLGANIGAHTLPLAKKVGVKGRVIAVEATQFAINKLRQSLSLNPSLEPTVIAIHALLVAESHPDTAQQIKTEIHSSWPLSGSGKVHATLGGSLKSTGNARVITVDELLAEIEIAHIDWIKLDVDGHEMAVLKGAKKIIFKCRPRILMEFAPYCYADVENGFNSLISLLSEYGYEFYNPKNGKKLPSNSSNLCKLIPREGSINVLCIAK
jgi:FkbM family methyltransferase